MRIDNALVEETFCLNENSGHLIVSYSTPSDRNSAGAVQRIRLNLNRNTVIRNIFGQNVCLCCIRRGMRISAVTSPRMTRSIPPQTNALLVVVQRSGPQPPRPQPPRPQPPRPQPPQPPRPQPPRPQPPQPPRPQPSTTTTGRIIKVDFDNRTIVTEDLRDSRNQMQFAVTDRTSITNRFGRPIRFAALEPGQTVRVTHANFQTPSIPPQTTAFDIQVL